MDPLNITEGAIKSLLSQVGSILLREAGLLAGVKTDVDFIVDEFESMAFVFRALSEKQDQDLQLKIWMKQVRELAYDVEDAIEVFAHLSRRPHGKHFLSRTIQHIQMLKDHHRLALDLKILKNRACEVSERRIRYDLYRNLAAPSLGAPISGSRSMSNSSVRARLSPPLLDEVKPVGIDKGRDKIIQWLLEDKQHLLRVISIVGFCGSGKTTLAMTVFESSMVAGASFQARGWIAVSQSFEPKALLQRLAPQMIFADNDIREAFALDSEKKLKREELEREMKNRMDGMDEAKLGTTIRDHLKEKRYVIVLDDIRSIRVWKSIIDAFPNNDKGSRIIVTTRDIQVANTCSSSNHQFIYRMPPLDDHNSWELFCKRVFDAPDYTCLEFLENASKNILKKCGGLPLAILTIAGALAFKSSKTATELEKFLDRLNYELDTYQGFGGILQILTLCYDDLPYYLKPCLLYLSTFPEDYEISRKRLVNRWMAEGLISGKRGMSDQEVAEGYFYELIYRNLIQPSKINSQREVETCRVNDVMLELIVSLSMDDNFITVPDDYTSIPVNGKIRRIVLRQSSSTRMHDINLSHARSLTIFSMEMPLFDYRKMSLLRVLDMEGCRSLTERHLNKISKLFLLRFLSLRDTSIRMLPRSIGDLQCLQFLDTRGCRLVKIPNSIVKLQRLANFLYDVDLKLPKGIGKMKALQKYGSIEVVLSCTRELQGVGELTNLEHLELNFREVIPSWFGQYLTRRGLHISSMKRKSMQICASLEKLHKCLRSLRITDQDGMLMVDLCKLSSPPLHLEEISLEGQMKTLPAWFEFLNRITKITLANYGKFENGITLLAVLKSIPTLVYLYIRSDHEKWCFDSQGFKCLQKLHIFHADEMNFNVGALPALEILFLWDFGRISGVEHLTKLSELRIGGITSEMSAQLKEEITESGHPNHPKVVVEDQYWNFLKCFNSRTSYF